MHRILWLKSNFYKFLSLGSVVSALWLTGCTSVTRLDPLIRLDVQDIGFAEPALARSVNAFVGDDNSGSGGDAGSGTDGDDFGDENLDDVNFRIRDLHEIALGFTALQTVGRGTKIGTRVLLGHGRTEIRLPDGVDVFVEPITITAKTRFIEAVLIGEQTLFWPRFLSERTSFTIEAGYRKTRSRVALRSPLIRRDDTGTDTQTILGVGLRHKLGPRRATLLDIGVRQTRSSTPIVRLGIERRF